MSCFSMANGALCAVVCDGAGSAEFGGEGASIVARTISQALRQHFHATSLLPGDEDIWTWLDAARDRVSLAAERRDKTRRSFASTLVMLASIGDRVVTAHVGDGAVVARNDAGWETLSAPENGEFASSTYFVTDDPAPRLRVRRREGKWTAYAVFSDGIEQVALDHQNDAPHAPFFNTMIEPLDRLSHPGKNGKLSDALAAFLSGSRICERTDDDKTLLLISAS